MTESARARATQNATVVSAKVTSSSASTTHGVGEAVTPGTGPSSSADADASVRGRPVLVGVNQDQTRTESLADKDALSRERIAKALAQLLQHRKDEKPLSIALFGPWGAGKSTLIGFVRNELAKGSNTFECAEFNAWQNERVDNMSAALAQKVVDAVAGELGFFEQLGIGLKIAARRKARLHNAIKRSADALSDSWKLWFLTYVVPFAWPISLLIFTFAISLVVWFSPLSKSFAAAIGVVGGAATLATGFISAHVAVFKGLLESFKKLAKDQNLKDRMFLPDYSERLGSAHEIGRTLEDLCALTLRARGGRPDKQLLVVVDDLDRCAPAAIKQVFDAVRLVANIERVSVIVALDDRIAYAAVAKFFSDFGIVDREPSQLSRDYMGKVFNVSVRIQAAAEGAVENYIRAHIFEQSGSGTPDADAQQGAPTDEPGRQSGATANPGEALPHEVEAFVEFAREFNMTNPRELWRLRQTWSLLKGMALPSPCAQSELRLWMRHMFFREVLLQGMNEQRKRSDEYLQKRMSSLGQADGESTQSVLPAPECIANLMPRFEQVTTALEAGFGDRDSKILAVLLPAAPPELAKPPSAPASPPSPSRVGGASTQASP
jgi:Cdc6-like AAA superfamily ATPase